ncbi:MAG TPA: hypothetical protein VK425_13385 [Acidimicrobiales bacterium]|nr:hypothetical protein [Acidimicrobiales bacterium]
MTAVAHSPGAGRSRAVRPGSRRARYAAAAAVFALLLGALGYGLYGLWANSHQGYVSGNPAKWLSKQQLDKDVGQTLVGTYAFPAVTVAGDDVRVETPTFSALAVVTGPAVPGEGLSYQPQYLTSTWTVHIWDVKGNIALSAKDFDTIDHVGTEFQLHVPQGSTMPTSVPTGGRQPSSCALWSPSARASSAGRPTATTSSPSGTTRWRTTKAPHPSHRLWAPRQVALTLQIRSVVGEGSPRWGPKRPKYRR